MDITVRSYLTAGVALAGASVIAVAPAVAPPPMTVAAPPISSVAVDLSAAVNPITAWVDVFAGAAENLGGLGNAWLQDPFPLLRQALENVLGYGGTVVNATTGAIEGALEFLSFDNTTGLWAQLRTATTQLLEGNIAGAFNTLSDGLILGPIFNIGLPVFTSGLLEIPGKIVQNAANIVKTLTSLDTLLPVVLGALAPVMGSIAATGETLQAAFDSLRQGELIDAVITLVNIPAVVVGAVLNGYTKADETFLPGLFTFRENAFEGGLLQALLVTLPKALAAAIAPDTETPTTAADGPADTLIGAGTMVTITDVSQTETPTEVTADATAETAPGTTPTEPAPIAPAATEPAEEPALVAETPEESGAPAAGDTTETAGTPEAPEDVTAPDVEDDAAPGTDETEATDEDDAEDGGAVEDGGADEDTDSAGDTGDESGARSASDSAGSDGGSSGDE